MSTPLIMPLVTTSYFQIDERVEESEGDGGRCKVWCEINYAHSLSYEECNEIFWT